MISINAGFNFDPELPDIIANLNHADPEGLNAKVTEVYGSVPGIGLGSVRSKSRLKDLDIDETCEILQKLVDVGIEMNYTVNTSSIGTLADVSRLLLLEGYSYLRILVRNKLIKRLTVSHPLLMEILSGDLGVPIEVSTVTSVETPGQLIALHKRAPTIDKICMNLNHNRNFSMLRAFVKLGKELGIKIELLVNEFCTYRCVDRDYCYALQSCQTARETLYDTYPHGRCIATRDDPVEWLKARFILPQWMQIYSKWLGVKHFKLTGRTHPTPYIKRMIEIYLSEDFGGNLLDLWAHLENIESEEEVGPKFYIPVVSNKDKEESEELQKGITWNGYIMPPKRWNTCDRTCDVGCNHCRDYLKKIGHKTLR